MCWPPLPSFGSALRRAPATCYPTVGRASCCWVSPPPGPSPSSSDYPPRWTPRHPTTPFLRPDNALRIAKSFVEALVLLPFLRQREREYADGISRLGWGVAAGIIAVTLVVLAERALFPGLWDFSGDYRVTGPFSSMQVGGGHIGAYIALALPMTLCLPRLRPRSLGMGLLLLTCLLGGYTLTVTLRPYRLRRRRGRHGGRRHRLDVGLPPPGPARRVGPFCRLCWSSRSWPSPLPLPACGSVSPTPRGDYATREDNWRAGLAVRDTGVLPTVFGMGLGTYQRAMEMRSAVNRPSDLVIRPDGQGAYLSMRVEAAFFFGQKIELPAAGPLHLTLQARSSDTNTSLGVALCDKVLLYSDQCRGSNVTINAPDAWQTVSVTLPIEGLGAGFGWLHRPVELSLAAGPAGHHIDIRAVRLTSEAGDDLVSNGDFSHGLDRWVFTDDNHISWRMKDLYLMLWFQTGILGVVAFLAFSGLALAGGIRAAWRGAVTGAAVAGSISGFLMSGLFDDVIEPPRLATRYSS